RDPLVTGVQTCALPISVPEDRGRGPRGAPLRRLPPAGGKEPLARLRLQSAVVPARDCRIADHHGTALPRLPGTLRPIQIVFSRRSEERRVGKECRARGW